METPDKNGHASMEEILASIRKIIAEDPMSSGSAIQIDPQGGAVKGDGLLEDASDFDLPSMFRPAPAPAAERPAPLLGRLTDAIRAASAGGNDTARPEPALSSLHLQRTGGLAANSSPPERAGSPAAPAFMLANFHETTGATRGDDPGPQKATPPPTVEASPSPPVAKSASFETAQPGVTHGDVPEVPRQMAPFKDTRFRSMGAWPTPLQAAATLAPVTFSAPVTSLSQDSPSAPEAAPARHASPTAAEPPTSGPAPAYPIMTTLRGAETEPQLPPSPQRADLSQTSAFPAAPTTYPAPPGSGTPATTASAGVEDATADLLRPMLRQWLAENMPRMVEKALSIELAEATRSPPKPNGVS